MAQDRFSRLEARIEQLIEGSFARLFNDRLHPREVALRLARAVEDNLRTEADGSLIAPNLFVVCLHTDDLTDLARATPDLAQHLCETVTDFANRAGVRLMSAPRVELCANESVNPRGILITATHADPTRSTQVMPALPPSSGSIRTPELAARRPYLILQGKNTIPLDRGVINIGRKRENHIVIDDPRVSRLHAQLRLRYGRYVLYDLGSRGGTLVNSARVTETILQPGDVISLAGVMLVYMEDDGNGSGQNIVNSGDTQMRDRPDFDRATDAPLTPRKP